MKLFVLSIYLDSTIYYFSSDEKRMEFKEKYAKMFNANDDDFNYEDLEIKLFIDPDFEKMFVGR